MLEHFAAIMKDGNYCLVSLKRNPLDQWKSADLDFVAIICAGKLGDDFKKLVTYQVPPFLLNAGYSDMPPAAIDNFEEIVERSLQRHAR